MATSKLNLPTLTEKQALAYITINEALALLDATAHLSVINQTTSAPPGSPSEGDAYVVNPTGTGDWAGEDENIAIYINGAWKFVTASEGIIFYDQNVNSLYVYDGSTNNWEKFGVSITRNIRFRHDDFLAVGGAVAQQLGYTSFSLKHWRFTNGVDHGISAQFLLPKHASGDGIQCRIYWTTNANLSGNIRWKVSIHNVEETEDISSATVSTTEETQVPAAHTSRDLIVSSVALPNLPASVNEESLLVLEVEKLGSHVDDTFTGLMYVPLVVLQYNEKFPLDPDWS
jgi:hypothetical protein